MNKLKMKLKGSLLFFILVGYYLFKTSVAYTFDFSLGINSLFQVFIAFISILGISSLLYGVSFFPKNRGLSNVLLIFFNVVLTGVLLMNIYYYREFSDFMGFEIMLKSSGSLTGLSGMSSTIISMLKWYDFIYFIDTLLLPFYLYSKKRQNTEYQRSFLKAPFAIILCFLTVFLANIDRPQLLNRSFDNNYLVKYLGVSGFSMKSFFEYNQLKTLRADATENDLLEVEDYITSSNKIEENNYTGIAKDKNVIYIHLESLHGFIQDLELPDSEGNLHEVTPFLNKIFHSEDTLAFSNAFHQVSQGKTSDAEFMLENSVFGTVGASAMVKFGTDNTFYSAPSILKGEGYTSQVFHGNVDTFWNRKNAYKSFGYDNFYSLKTYENQEVINYGLRDDVFFKESFDKYLTIEGKKYSKFIPVSHHFPYDYSELEFEVPFEIPNTSDSTVNGYFVTASYMDKQIESFYKSLEEAGELENTLFIFYSDHFGISNSRTKDLGEVLAPEKEWSGFDNAMVQKIPLMYHIPESNVNPQKEVSEKYVGQVDVLPTVLNLLGVDYTDRLFFGQDMLGNYNDNIVEFRDGSFVNNEYTFYKGKYYYTKTGERIEDITLLPIEEQEYINQLNQNTQIKLKMSDKILNQNLLQFRYSRPDKSIYNY